MTRKKHRKHRTAPRRPAGALDLEEVAAIVERTKTALSAQEHAKLKAAMDTLASTLHVVAQLTAELQSKEASVERLRRMLFGTKTEKTEEVLGEPIGLPGLEGADADPRQRIPGRGPAGAVELVQRAV